MLSVYDLYDLHAIFVAIRQFPEYELNEKVLLKTINVFEKESKDLEVNRFRATLRTIANLDRDIYKFPFTENLYTYYPSSLKDKNIYNILIESCKCLLNSIREKNKEKIMDLADCLHNLPIAIVENHLKFPKEFWEREIKYYSKKWDKDFLIKLQSLLSR